MELLNEASLPTANTQAPVLNYIKPDRLTVLYLTDMRHAYINYYFGLGLCPDLARLAN